MQKDSNKPKKKVIPKMKALYVSRRLRTDTKKRLEVEILKWNNLHNNNKSYEDALDPKYYRQNLM